MVRERIGSQIKQVRIDLVGATSIHGSTLALNAILSPAIFAGIFIGRWLTARIPQRLFDGLLLAFAALAALRLIGVV